MAEVDTAATQIGTGDLEPLLSAWRTEQSQSSADGRNPVRFVIERGKQQSDTEIAGAIGGRYNIGVQVGPLFADEPALERFRLLIVKRVTRPDRADLFELANDMRGVLGAVTVEPDLGTNYYEGDADRPAPGTPESSDFAFWCWVGDGARPNDPNWAITKTNVIKAWVYAAEKGKATKGNDILIFQPDTGVVPQHAELPPNSDKDPRSANFVEGGTTPLDQMQSGGNPGHGTGTGSVVASPEGGRMVGSAPLSKLVPIRCIETVAVFDQSPVAQAIDHARRKGAHVITMSLGGIFSSALRAAIRQAVQSNAIVLAAAGNCVGEVVWPARYRETIAVAGINEAFKPWRGSCNGSAIDISAPAELVLRADPRSTSEPHAAVDGGQGTSFAVALTAGVAALWLAHHGRDALIAKLPAVKTLQWMFRNLVMATAHKPQGFDHENFGAGIVDALALLQIDPNRANEGPGELEAAGLESDAIELRELVYEAFGTIGVEAAAPAIADRQHRPEIACAAFDRLRARPTRKAHTESLPPSELSPSLRASLGARAAALR